MREDGSKEQRTGGQCRAHTNQRTAVHNVTRGCISNTTYYKNVCRFRDSTGCSSLLPHATQLHRYHMYATTINHTPPKRTTWSPQANQCPTDLPPLPRPRPRPGRPGPQTPRSGPDGTRRGGRSPPRAWPIDEPTRSHGRPPTRPTAAPQRRGRRGGRQRQPPALAGSSGTPAW